MVEVGAVAKKAKAVLKPRGNRILVKEDGFKYEGIIEIPQTAQRRATTGVIVDVGPLGDRSEIGRHILYAHFSGTGIKLKEHPAFRILSPDEILLDIEGEGVEIEEVSA